MVTIFSIRGKMPLDIVKISVTKLLSICDRIISFSNDFKLFNCSVTLTNGP